MHTLVRWGGGGEREGGWGGAERGVPWHTNRHDRNKIKRVGLRQNMYGPLNRELIKELKLLVLSAEHCLITHQKSHYLNSEDSLKCLLKQRKNAAPERQMSLPVLAGVSA